MYCIYICNTYVYIYIDILYTYYTYIHIHVHTCCGDFCMFICVMYDIMGSQEQLCVMSFLWHLLLSDGFKLYQQGQVRVNHSFDFEGHRSPGTYAQHVISIPNLWSTCPDE